MPGCDSFTDSDEKPPDFSGEYVGSIQYSYPPNEWLRRNIPDHIKNKNPVYGVSVSISQTNTYIKIQGEVTYTSQSFVSDRFIDRQWYRINVQGHISKSGNTWKMEYSQRDVFQYNGTGNTLPVITGAGCQAYLGSSPSIWELREGGKLNITEQKNWSECSSITLSASLTKR